MVLSKVKRDCEMAVALNRSTQILIDNFIDKHFQGNDKADKATIKQEVFEIADSILEQSNKDLDRLATKSDISKLEVKIAESKADTIRWVVTAQIAIAGLIIAVMKWL